MRKGLAMWARGVLTVASILRFIEKAHIRTVTLFSVLLALAVVWIDFITGKAVQFPLVYVLPVGVAAWRNQRKLAYALALALPMVRGVHEFSMQTGASPVIACVNGLIEAVALLLYAYLVDRTATQTRRMKKTISVREQEISRLRAFARKTSTTLQGLGLSPGMVEGVARLHLPPESEESLEHRPIAPGKVEAEIARLDSALAAANGELENAQKQFAGRRADASNALLDAHRAMLNDVAFWDKCRKRVREDLIQVEQAVTEEVREMVAILEEMKQEVMRERSADIRDIGRRVLRNIRTSGETSAYQREVLPPHTILVAKELLPSDVLQLDHANLAGLVTERNSPASHVAILARTRNIPAVSDIQDATLLLATGDRLLVDGEAGTVTVAPTQAQAELFVARKNRSAAHESATDPVQETTTKDGVTIGLFANISRTDEARLVLEYQMDGVGLFRSEFLFLHVDQPPDRAAQATAYSAVTRMLNPRPVVIRTMDFGGDKLPRFNRTENDLAFRMGKRGLAFSLSEKKLFHTQLQAILQAAQGGDVRIMFPMVMGVADLTEARRWVDEIAEVESFARRPSIGAMIETPAAVFDIQEIVKIVDFVSIGTNDLSHFILATDRQTTRAPGAIPFLHPSVLRATAQVVRVALKQGVGLAVCGEAAGNPAAICLLLGMGVRVLSVNPFQAKRVRDVLRQLTIEQTELAVRDALAVKTSDDVMQVVTPVLRGLGTT